MKTVVTIRIKILERDDVSRREAQISWLGSQLLLTKDKKGGHPLKEKGNMQLR
jgi:hypothetical protein